MQGREDDARDKVLEMMRKNVDGGKLVENDLAWLKLLMP
jgi:hypothetical protein